MTLVTVRNQKSLKANTCHSEDSIPDEGFNYNGELRIGISSDQIGTTDAPQLTTSMTMEDEYVFSKTTNTFQDHYIMTHKEGMQHDEALQVAAVDVEEIVCHPSMCDIDDEYVDEIDMNSDDEGDPQFITETTNVEHTTRSNRSVCRKCGDVEYWGSDPECPRDEEGRWGIDPTCPRNHVSMRRKGYSFGEMMSYAAEEGDYEEELTLRDTDCLE